MRKIICTFTALVMVLAMGAQCLALEAHDLDKPLADMGKYIQNTVKNPQVGSVGGEWAVLGLARGNFATAEYFQTYYRGVEEYVKACGGKLHDKKYTEYSRLIVALTAIGKNPENVAGFNLLTPLGDYDKVIWQGLNGPIWALIALDSGNYQMPINKSAATQASRDMYIERILDCQLPDGGWSLFGGTAAASQTDNLSDPDITGMVFQALAPYRDRADVKTALEAALSCMSKQQNERGGFSSKDGESLESSVQIIVGLCHLGISLDDPRFVKNSKNLFDNLMSYYKPGKGFSHAYDDSGSDLMSSEQGLYALVAIDRSLSSSPSLYQITDPLKLPESSATTDGLANKNADVKKMPIKYIGKTFSDISTHKNQPAIEALAARGIIDGKSRDIFDPDGTMTRAEFSAIIVKALGLSSQGQGIFSDVVQGDWFFSYVNTAAQYQIISGGGDGTFNPLGIITREQAAVMIAKAATLCGMDTSLDTSAARDMLAGFTDYVKASDWAVSSLGFCVSEGIISSDDIQLMPKQAVTRGEIGQMLFAMLTCAKLV